MSVIYVTKVICESQPRDWFFWVSTLGPFIALVVLFWFFIFKPLRKG